MPERVAAAPFHDRARFERAARERRWNNAHLADFRTYQGHRPAFAKLLETCRGDMPTFITRVRALAGGDDPLAELARMTARD
jgi:predicted aminopeptidase